MAGIYEHNKARPGKPILTGAVSAETEDSWKNMSCGICEKITHTCQDFWDHQKFEHHITSNNIAIFHEYVQQLINNALEPNSAHFIVTLIKCAQSLVLIDVNGFHDVGAEDVTILQHLDPFGQAIIKQATSDPFFQAILKKVTIHFLNKYGTLIQANWDITKRVKSEIKQEFAVKQEPKDQLENEIKPNEHNQESENGKQHIEGFQSLSNIKREPVRNVRIPRAKITKEAIANGSEAFTTGGKGKRTPDEVILALKALTGSAPHRYKLKQKLKQKREWLNIIRVAVNMVRLILRKKWTLKLTNEVKKIRLAHQHSKAVFEVNRKEEIETSVEIERKPADATDAQNSGGGFKRTPDVLTLALQDHESFLMEYKRTREIIDEVQKKREAHKICEGVSTLERQNGIKTSTESVKKRRPESQD